jgi:hypothetical protein
MMTDKNYSPMTDFDKIVRFELVNNFVNLDFYGEFKEFYKDVEGFPTSGTIS